MKKLLLAATCAASLAAPAAKADVYSGQSPTVPTWGLLLTFVIQENVTTSLQSPTPQYNTFIAAYTSFNNCVTAAGQVAAAYPAFGTSGASGLVTLKGVCVQINF